MTYTAAPAFVAYAAAPVQYASAPVAYAAAPACETYAGAPVQYASAPGASLVETVDAAELPRPPEAEALSELERAMLVADLRRIDMADVVAVAAVISRHEALRCKKPHGWYLTQMRALQKPS